MTIVHSEAPWGHSQQERLAPKERTHPMRPLSCNNNTTTRLKRGPNPLSGVLILNLIYIFFFGYFFLYYLFLYFFFFGIFLYLFFCHLFFIFYFLFIYLFVFFLVLFFFLYIFLYLYLYFFFSYLRLYVVPLGTTTTDHQVPRLQRGPNPLSGILIPRPPGDNHNQPSSP